MLERFNANNVAGGQVATIGGMPQSSTTPPMSEVQYAAQEADEALRTLEKAVHELVARLEPILAQEQPTPPQGVEKAQRPISSRMGNALCQHARQTEALSAVVFSALRRLAL